MKRINQDGEVAYATRDFAVRGMAIQILQFLNIPYGSGASEFGPTLSIPKDLAPKFEEEVTQWRLAAAKLIIT